MIRRDVSAETDRRGATAFEALERQVHRDVYTPARNVSKGVSADLAPATIREFAEAHGWHGPLSSVAFALWATRHEIEGGSRRPAVVNAVELPDDVPGFVRLYWQGFLLLLECRWLYEPHRGKPALFTHDWASSWCGLALWQCKTARAYLKKLGALVDTGERVGQAKKWLPRTET